MVRYTFLTTGRRSASLHLMPMRFLKGAPSDLVEVKSIQLSPDPPVPGQDLTVTASGYVKDTIEVCPALWAMNGILISL